MGGREFSIWSGICRLTRFCRGCKCMLWRDNIGFLRAPQTFSTFISCRCHPFPGRSFNRCKIQVLCRGTTCFVWGWCRNCSIWGNAINSFITGGSTWIPVKSNGSFGRVYWRRSFWSAEHWFYCGVGLSGNRNRLLKCGGLSFSYICYLAFTKHLALSIERKKRAYLCLNEKITP